MDRKLIIYQYKNKDGKPYKMCYYNGKFYFVHISTEKIKTCIIETRKGLRVLIYNGQFEVNEESIDIR